MHVALDAEQRPELSLGHGASQGYDDVEDRHRLGSGAFPVDGSLASALVWKLVVARSAVGGHSSSKGVVAGRLSLFVRVGGQFANLLPRRVTRAGPTVRVWGRHRWGSKPQRETVSSKSDQQAPHVASFLHCMTKPGRAGPFVLCDQSYELPVA